MIPIRRERPLTENPLFLTNLCQFVYHLAETLASIYYTVNCFETFTYNLVDQKSWNNKLKTKCQDGVTRSKEIPTLAAATNASFHELPTSDTFAHIIKNGEGGCGSRLVRSVLDSLCRTASEATSPTLSGAERQRWAKSNRRCCINGRQDVEHNLTRDPLGKRPTHIDLFVEGV